MKKHHASPQPPPYQVDVVIPIFGQLEFLQTCLDKLPGAFEDIPFQVLALDNGSPLQGATEIVLNKFPQAKSMRSKENLGFPKGCNTASKWGRAPLIFFLNTDCFLEPKSGKILVEDMIDDPKIGVLGMKLLFPEDTPSGPAGRVQHAGIDLNIKADAVHTFIGWKPDNPRVNIRCEPYAVTGAALMTRRTLWQRAGGFFEAYGKGTWEDVDYCLTVRDMGYKIIYEPRAVGYHYVGASMRAGRVTYQLNENGQLFRYKWSGKLYWSEWERS